MGTFPPIDKSLLGILRDNQERITLLERKQARAGTGGGGGSGSNAASAGVITPYAGGGIPSGWLLCDGSAVPRIGYPELFSAIGTTWGVGNGSTTFNLPNLKGRTVVGLDGSQVEFDTMGETGGAKTHTLTVAEMPSHTHGRSKGNDNNIGGDYGWQSIDDGYGDFQIGATGGGGAHNNMPPFAVANWIISTGSGIAGGGSNTPALPLPVTAFATNPVHALTQAAVTWVDIPGAAATFVLADPMWVEVEFGAQLQSDVTNTYAMIGVRASGALNLEPEYDQASGALQYAFTPFAYGDSENAHGSKTLLLPRGTTTIQLRSRRDNAIGVQNANYGHIIVNPMSWAGAPGQVNPYLNPMLIVPVSVSGGTFDPVTRRTNLTPGTSQWSFNGVFTNQFKAYRVLYNLYSDAAFQLRFRFRLNGVDSGAAGQYAWALHTTNGGIQGSTADSWLCPAVNSMNGHSGEIIVTEPMTTTGNQNQKKARGTDNGWPNTLTTWAGALGSNDATPFDGFSLIAPGSSITSGGVPWISVEGIV